MSAPKRPSDALAEIAAVLHQLECAPDPKGRIAGWIDRATEALRRLNPAKEWTLTPKELFGLPALKAIRWPLTTPKTSAGFTELVGALQALDRWHRPIVPNADGEEYELLEAHEQAEDLLISKSRFGGGKDGSIVPAVAWRRDRLVPPSYTGDAHPLVLPILLRETTYLPAVIRARDQDAATGKRRVRLSYERREYQWNGELDRNKTIKIAIAPMMEVSDDARFAMASCGTRYCVTPAYPQQRIADVIKAAISSGVDVLLLPEMCIPESDLEGMKNMVRVEAAAHLAMHKKSPRLRYVFAGVAGEPTPPATFHTNYVVVIDSGGAQVMKQGKLFRWDMDANWIERLGLHSDFGLTLPLAPDVCVKENVAPWDEIVLVDLTDMGRVLNLICADMSFDLPQDWLLQQCRLDWLYAPIMDRYIPDLAKRNWIVNAAFRAAPGIRAMVTNSMALTYRLNAENLRVSSEHGACNDCGIGLLVDGMSPAHSVYLRITASVGAHSPILKIAEWDPANWDDIPC